MGRYAFQNNDLFSGTNSLSPYQGFNTGQINRNQNFNLTATHAFSPRLFVESGVAYNRFLNLQPLGDAPSTTPCWQYALFNALPTGPIVFPGYAPDACGSAALPSSGAQNVYQTGARRFRGGGTRSKPAASICTCATTARSAPIRPPSSKRPRCRGCSTAAWMTVAIDPNGKAPGDIYDTRIDGSFRFPSFTRHFRYNEFAFYGEDSFKVRPGVTLTAGLRWEYFGVPHSPSDERFLDSNLVFPTIWGWTYSIRWPWGPSSRPINSTGPITKTSPRASASPGTSSATGGRSSGAATACSTTATSATRPSTCFRIRRTTSCSSYSPRRLSRSCLTSSLASAGPSLRITGSARMLDNDLRTAYSAQFNASLERDLGKGVTGSISYLGANASNSIR